MLVFQNVISCESWSFRKLNQINTISVFYFEIHFEPMSLECSSKAKNRNGSVREMKTGCAA